MCTVTFIGSKENEFILTSNRDEKILRETERPSIYRINSREVAFPKDKLAGGTWIAMGGSGVVCCLLNGAFELHESTGNYRKSRGQIVLDVFRYASIDAFVNECDLNDIEPFTLILFNARKKQLVQLVWDGAQKHIEELDASKHYFWSSATLYSPLIAKERKQRFFEVMAEENNIDAQRLLKLHQDTKQAGGFLLKTEAGIETVSVTQLILTSAIGTMTYHDLLKKDKHLIRLRWLKVLQ